MIEEQHVTQYGSLLNPSLSRLENLLIHQFTECYLYWSCYETESCPQMRTLWDFMFQQELMHLHMAENLLKEYEGRQWQQVIPDGNFPAPLTLQSNIEYVRGVLGSTVENTARREEYVPACEMCHSTFSDYQQQVNLPLENVTSHRVIEEYIGKFGQDYRYEAAPNPVPELRDRQRDNTSAGRSCLTEKQPV